MNEGTFIDSAKVFGKGKIQVPVDVRGILHLDDGDKIIFYQDTQGRVFLEKAPTLKKKALGKYR